MAAHKRNEYLDVGESESEGSGYDSEAAEAKRLLHTSKRRKTSHARTSEDESNDNASGTDSDDESPELKKRSGGVTETAIPKNNVSRTTDQQPQSSATENSRPSKDKSKRSENESKAKSKVKKKPKSGVVYLSRIPPFMKPSTVKHLLEQYGTITRVFLTPEDPKSHSARVRHGGNKKRSFVDGWVEFLHKRDAKLVAETLNANIIGGKKGSYYHDDVWNMRYLRGFKWKDLTEQIKNENAERASRLRMEIAQTTRENKRYVESVEKGKMLERMEGKRQRKNEKVNTAEDTTSKSRAFGQDHDRSTQPPLSERAAETKPKKPAQGTDVKKVLDMVL